MPKAISVYHSRDTSAQRETDDQINSYSLERTETASLVFGRHWDFKTGFGRELIIRFSPVEGVRL